MVTAGRGQPRPRAGTKRAQVGGGNYEKKLRVSKVRGFVFCQFYVCQTLIVLSCLSHIDCFIMLVTH